MTLLDKARELKGTHKTELALHNDAVSVLRACLDEFMLEANGLDFTFTQGETVAPPGEIPVTSFEIQYAALTLVVYVQVIAITYYVNNTGIPGSAGFQAVIDAIAAYVEDYLP